ncbi:MAG: CPBP family intramembrane metalloprotease [Candidatus Kapabacteria bacterium]|nr:CPBP family intramembrane metalloprotease [Candidatus Kapabacteria bacterium]
MSLYSRVFDPSHWVNRIAYVLMLTILAALGVYWIGISSFSFDENALRGVAEVVTIIFWTIVFGIMIRDEQRQPEGQLVATGIIPTRQTLPMILRGVLWAVALASPIALMCALLGGEFTVTALRFPPLVVLAIVISSIGEEVLFRSTVLRVLQDRFGSGWAIIVTSVLFSLAHTGNASASMISSINTFLIGVAFGTVIAVGGSIWVAASCHAAWNVLVSMFFGAVSGHDVGVSWIQYVPNNASSLSPLLMGDAYGVESGLLCTAVITISLGFIRHIVVVDPFVTAARYRVTFNRERSHENPITVMESMK